MINPNKASSRIFAFAVIATIGLTACKRHGEAPSAPSSTKRPSTSETVIPGPHSPQILRIGKATGEILFAEGTDGDHDIFLEDLEDGKVTDLTNTPGIDELNPQVSPNGKSVVIDGNASGTYQIYGFDLARPKKIKRLTKDGASDFDPTYTPDGNILYKSNKADGYGDIWIMTGKGTNQRNLTAGMKHTEEWKPTAISKTKYVFTSRHADDGSMSPQKLANTDELWGLDTANGRGPFRLTFNKYPDWYSEANPSQPGEIAYTSKIPTSPFGPDVIYQKNVSRPADKSKLLVNLPGDSSDPSWCSKGTLFFVNNGLNGNYQALARTSDGKIFALHSSDKFDVLSPVAASSITIS